MDSSRSARMWKRLSPAVTVNTPKDEKQQPFEGAKKEEQQSERVPVTKAAGDEGPNYVDGALIAIIFKQ